MASGNNQNQSPVPNSAQKGMSTPYQPAPAAGAQAQHHDDHHHHQPAATTTTITTTSTAQPHQQPTAGPTAASSPSPAAGPALAGDPLEPYPQLMDSQQRWARENGVLIVQRPTTATTRTNLDALRAERPQLRWEHKGMGVFFGYPRVAGEVVMENVQTVEEMESQFDREFAAIMKGRQGREEGMLHPLRFLDSWIITDGLASRHFIVRREEGKGTSRLSTGGGRTDEEGDLKSLVVVFPVPS